MAGAAIAGVGSTPLYKRGQSEPQTIMELIGKAVIDAAADAGIAVADIDGFACYGYGFEIALLMEMLGIPEITYSAVVSGQGGGSAGILDLAASAVETGRAKHVVCIGAAQQSKQRYGSVMQSLDPTPEGAFFQPAGLSGPGHMFALLARRHMFKYGTRREAFGEVAISSRLNASKREDSRMRTPLDMETYLASPIIADPLCLYDFCVETDGALAFVVTSTERARDLRQPVVHIAASHVGGSRDWGRAFMWMNMPDEMFASSGFAPLAAPLYGKAGIGPADIDVALLYDHFSPMVVCQLEDFGFCARGEGGPFVESGAIRLAGGSIPVNTHGGHLSHGYVIGMTHIKEAVEQMRGTAVNQVPGARHALISGGPAPVPLSAAILRKDI